MRIHLIHPNITYAEELDWHVYLHIADVKGINQIAASIAADSFTANVKCAVRGIKVTKTISLAAMMEGLRRDGEDSAIDSLIEQG